MLVQRIILLVMIVFCLPLITGQTSLREVQAQSFVVRPTEFNLTLKTTSTVRLEIELINPLSEDLLFEMVPIDEIENGVDLDKYGLEIEPVLMMTGDAIEVPANSTVTLPFEVSSTQQTKDYKVDVPIVLRQRVVDHKLNEGEYRIVFHISNEIHSTKKNFQLTISAVVLVIVGLILFIYLIISRRTGEEVELEEEENG